MEPGPDSVDADLEVALAELRASPLVKEISFNSTPEQSRACMLGCGVHAESTRQRYSEQLNITRERTSLAQCAIDLLKLINERHGGHLASAEAERAEAAAAAGPSTLTDAFAAMPAARSVKPAQERAALAEQRATEARAAQMAAEDALEAANKALASTKRLRHGTSVYRRDAVHSQRLRCGSQVVGQDRRRSGGADVRGGER